MGYNLIAPKILQTIP